MVGANIVLKRGNRDEAEKPFWISFADLMTALMVLFLLVMSVALLAVTKTVTDAERREAEWRRDIEILLNKVARAAARYPGVNVRGNVVDFGEKARFDTGSYKLRPSDEMLLRQFVPEILAIARDP